MSRPIALIGMHLGWGTSPPFLHQRVITITLSMDHSWPKTCHHTTRNFTVTSDILENTTETFENPMTPETVASLIITRYFGDVPDADLVTKLETCLLGQDELSDEEYCALGLRAHPNILFLRGDVVAEDNFEFLGDLITILDRVKVRFVIGAETLGNYDPARLPALLARHRLDEVVINIPVVEALSDSAIEYLNQAGTSLIQCIAATQHASDEYGSAPDLHGLTIAFLFTPQSSILVFEEILRSIYNTLGQWIIETEPELAPEEFDREMENLLNQFNLFLRPVGNGYLSIIDEAYHVAISHMLPERIFTFPVTVDYADRIGQHCLLYFT
jgi:hypothetical protein